LSEIRNVTVDRDSVASSLLERLSESHLLVSVGENVALSIIGEVIASASDVMERLVGPDDGAGDRFVLFDSVGLVGGHLLELRGSVFPSVDPFVDDVVIPNVVQVGLLTEEFDVDGVASEIVSVADVKGLVNVTDEVDEEDQGARLDSLSEVARLRVAGFVLQDLGVVLDGSDDAASDAVFHGEVGGILRKVAEMARLTPVSGGGVVVIVGNRGDVTESLRADHRGDDALGSVG